METVAVCAGHLGRRCILLGAGGAFGALSGGLDHVSDGHFGHERREIGHVGGGLPGADERRGFRHADRGTALPDFEWMLDHVTP